MKKEGKSKKAEEKELPGYPHYSAKEDITDPNNNNGKVNLNEENISLPDVSDIPGQEHIRPAPLGMLRDSTISSADEEGLVNGVGLDDEDEEVRIVMGTEADITAEDLALLGDEDPNIVGAELDSLDEDGERLSEITDDIFSTGDDLDIPGSEADDVNEALGEEDEENNYYSLGSEDNDNINEGTP